MRAEAQRYRHLWGNDVCGLRWGGWRGGCVFNLSDVTADDLSLATRVVDSFDVVFVMEWLSSTLYFCRAELLETGRGDAAAVTWAFRGDGSRRRRGCDVDIP